MLEMFTESCLCGREHTLKQGERVRSPPSEERVEAMTACDEVTTSTFPVLLC